MKRINLLSVIIFVTMTSFTTVGNAQAVKDYLAVPGPVSFSNDRYVLSWSAHPNESYFKQEYLPAGEKAETFTRMLLMEAVLSSTNLQSIVKAKIDELDARKKQDPLSNYQVIQNPKTGEYILDFLLSASAGNKTTVAEWNAYRYTLLPGKQGILLFAVSRRAYGESVPAFLRSLKTERPKNLNALSTLNIPVVKINN